MGRRSHQQRPYPVRSIVHDLYLYIALTKPDFSRVENLDNYLYQSLRHMYLSALTRASRDAMQSVTVADFDSVRVALWVKPNRDPLQQQNDLRLICAYAVWRKQVVRGASYFILRFFHGYRIEEIADIASVPLNTIQPRLSEVRTEVRAYVAEPSKTRETFRGAPPEPVQRWVPVSSKSFLQELRATILDSKTGKCLSETELETQYRSLSPRPVSTARLANIVSCEDCLARTFGIQKAPDSFLNLLTPGTFGHGGAFGTVGYVDPKNDLVMIGLTQMNDGTSGPPLDALVQITESALR